MNLLPKLSKLASLGALALILVSALPAYAGSARYVIRVDGQNAANVDIRCERGVFRRGSLFVNVKLTLRNNFRINEVAGPFLFELRTFDRGDFTVLRDILISNNVGTNPRIVSAGRRLSDYPQGVSLRGTFTTFALRFGRPTDFRTYSVTRNERFLSPDTSCPFIPPNERRRPPRGSQGR